MKHEVFNKKIGIEETDITFETIYNKPFIPKDYIEDIVNVNTHMYKKWNILMYNNGITHLLRESPEAHACL